MPTITVLLHAPLRDRLFDAATRRRLEALGTVRWHDREQPPDEAAVIAMARDADAVIGGWGTPAPSEKILDACPRLRLWEHAAGSVKHLFTPAAVTRGLTIASCKGALAACVAELVVGELIVGLRRVLEHGAAQRAGAEKRAVPEQRLLMDARVGIVGASDVGRRTIALLKPFGCAMTVFDPYLDAAGAERLGAERATDLERLCATCDAVSLHVPALPETAKMMGAKQFAAMRPGTVFVNTARGMCVDEAALADACASGRISAFLDVTEPEPAAPDSPLRRVPGVVLTPHIAGPPCFLLGRHATDDVAAWLGGGAPRAVVTVDQLARLA